MVENQFVEFGKAEVDYSQAKLIEFINDSDIKGAKKYINQYFIRMGDPVSIKHWCPSKNDFLTFSYEMIAKSYIPIIKKKPQNGEVAFNPYGWFTSYENPYVYHQDIDVKQPKFFERKGSQYMNLFGGYKWTTKKEYQSFSKSTKKSVELLWTHIKNILCSKNEELFNYTRNHLIHLVCGKKMKKGLYLKSGQGTGKSIVFEFLMEKVLGPSLFWKTSSPDVVIGQFNGQLEGKLILYLEEIRCKSVTEWDAFSNALKDLMTASEIEIERKHGTPYLIYNLLSIIMVSNKEALKLEYDDRRWIVLDISEEMKGNLVYFEELLTATRSEEVGEAFYWYCMENFDESFNPEKMPETESKMALRSKNLKPIQKFLRDECILKKRDILEKFSDVYDAFDSYGKKNIRGWIMMARIEFSKELKSLGIVTKRGGQGVTYIKQSWKPLYDKFLENKWITELDEFEDVGKVELEVNDDDVEVSVASKKNAAKQTICKPTKLNTDSDEEFDEFAGCKLVKERKEPEPVDDQLDSDIEDVCELLKPKTSAVETQLKKPPKLSKKKSKNSNIELDF